MKHESVQSPCGPIIIMLQLDCRQHSLLAQPGPDIFVWTLMVAVLHIEVLEFVIVDHEIVQCQLSIRNIIINTGTQLYTHNN